MPVNNLEFGAQVSAWVAKTEARLEAVFRASTQKVVSEAQRLIPVDTGFARASIRASLDAMPQTEPDSGQAGQTYSYDAGAISTVIANARLGQTIYIGWTANYAPYLEYGHSSQAPSGFVRIAAMQWPRFVQQASAEAKASVERRSI